MGAGNLLPPFLNPDPLPASEAKFGVLPFGFEGTVSYGAGTSQGPRAILEASAQVEFYDETLACEPCRAGIITYPEPILPENPGEAVSAVREATAAILQDGRLPVVLGGEHSISLGVYQALSEKYPGLGVIQFDAHADLREEYQGTPYSHASVMARIREETRDVLQLGIRSLSLEEAERISANSYAVGLMKNLRGQTFDVKAALAKLPEKVFITFDVDALDLSLVRSTGTPEPGGFTWDEINALLELIFDQKQVVGFDLVELCDGDAPSAYTIAKLAYRMMGLCCRCDGRNSK
ncbi:MAG: agmatinase [Planctomycetes bacterium]|nr:agmatinase [Planctomycetota bacterium]